tara:strand:- start:5107 stop:5505 length:399 start_codon:yes stop_codon:yes gene_type:complete
MDANINDRHKTPTEILEKNIQRVLQCPIEFWAMDAEMGGPVHNKPIKAGKLKLYRLKDFYIQFDIDVGTDINKIYEVPYPFKTFVCESSRRVIFDYTIKTLSSNNSELFYKLKLMSKQKKTKFYNSYLAIHF